MTADPAAPVWTILLNPVGRLGNAVLSFAAYFGGLASLAAASIGLALRPWTRLQLPDGEKSLVSESFRQLYWMLALGLPLVGLVHVGMGSFLALQAYYGSTFVDGAGAVVGVGLARNLATLMTGLTLSGFLSAKMIPELRALRTRPLPESADSSPARFARTLRGASTAAEYASPAALAAARIAAATAVSPVLAFWGFLVGTVVGWQSADAMLGVQSSTFFLMFLRMIWYRDVVGIMVKGVVFGFLIGLIAAFEGLRGDGPAEAAGRDDSAEDRSQALVHAVVRSTCLAMIAILIANSSWFILAYHSVPNWGPTLLKPPSP